MKKIIVCILSIFLILGLTEASCLIQEVVTIIEESQKIHSKLTKDDIRAFISYSYKKKKEFMPEEVDIRKPAIGTNPDKKAIIITGCSYAYGYLLNEKDCIHSVLSRITGRTVSNLGTLAGGIREVVWFLRNKDELSKHINNDFDVQYVIFIYNEDSKRKVFYDESLNCPQMKINKDKTIAILPDNPIFHLFTYKLYQLIRYDLMTEKTKNEIFSLYFKTIDNETKELFPNSQFIVLDYANESTPELQDLEKDGIKVITLGKELNVDLHQKQFKASDNNHPNAKVWDLTAKMLKEKLDL